MVRLTDADAIVFDWLNGDIGPLRRDYERVRAKPVPDDAAWLRVGKVDVLRFLERARTKADNTLVSDPAPEAVDPMWHPLLPLGRSAERSEAMRGSQPLARRLMEPLIRPSATFSPRGEAESRTIGEPSLETTALIYFHGGGFIVGSPVTHADVAERLARHTGLPVYSVDYRLAPEHPAPAPSEDGIAVIRHLLDTGIEKIVICGDSAGGAIALATEARLSKDIKEHVAGVASFYGAHGLLDTVSIIQKGSRADGTDRDCVARYFDLAGRDAYSIQTLARPSPVPVYLIAAENDALRDDALILAVALREQGRAVTLDRVPAADHGFLHGGGENHVAEQAAARFAAWLDSLLR